MIAPTVAERWLPWLDVGIAALAAAIWYVRPQDGFWPLSFIALAWLLRRLLYGHFSRRTALDPLLILFLVSALVGAVIAFNQDSHWVSGPAPFMWSWAKFWSIVAAVAMFYSVANLRNFQDVWRYLYLYALVGVLVALFYVLTHDWSAGPTKFPELTRLGASLTGWLPRSDQFALPPNIAGGIIAMTVPWLVPPLLKTYAQRQWRKVLVLGVMAGIALLGLLLTESRGAWIALSLTMAGWLVLGRVQYLRRSSLGWKHARWRVAPWMWIAVTAVLALCLMWLGTNWPFVVGVASSITTAVATDLPGGVNGVSRLQLLRSSWPLVQDHLLTGGGLGAFPMLYSTYALLIPVYFLPNSHNIILDILAEQGLFGLLAYLMILSIFAVQAVHSIRSLNRSSVLADADQIHLRRVLECSLVSAAIGIGHSLVEDVLYGSIVLILLFMPQAVVFAMQANFPPMRVHFSWKWIASAGTLAAMILLWNQSTVLGVWYADLGSLAQARVELSNYQWPDRLPEMARRDGDLSLAISLYQNALNADRENRTANQRLGAIELARGQYTEALAHLEIAFSSDPANEATGQLLGDTYLGLGRLDEAFVLWSKVRDAASKLDAEAWSQYEVHGDHQRATWARLLAERIRAARNVRP